MGRLVDGKWTTTTLRADPQGRFLREATRFRNQIRADGSTPYSPQRGRYHLYVSLACPWAHRTLLARHLRGLESVVSLSVVHPHMGENGWEFRDGAGCSADHVNHARFLREIYVKSDPHYTGTVTVPVLWDIQTSSIVCNESRLILRMLNRAFEPFAQGTANLSPPELEADLDREMDALYESVNNGVYRVGFARTQVAYDEAVSQLFKALDHYEARLSQSRYLFGATLTEADLCLFTTLLRFDVVYHYHFKCNLRRLTDYPNLWGFTRDIYQLPGVSEICNLDHIKQHYYTSHPDLNPRGIIPVGPTIDLDAPHGRS
ncbi:MAG TPA: glutathione S-transferase family protein [Polyangiaceae bacterium]|nr:glutathione S-transferase family protein [Polyangiaceae bacterium]